MTVLVSLVAIAVAAFSLVTAIRMARSDIPKKKRWVFFSLLGVGTLTYTSSSGDFGIIPMSFQILSAGFLAEFPGREYVIKVSFPFGAVLALRHLRAAPYEAASADEPPSAS